MIVNKKLLLILFFVFCLHSLQRSSEEIPSPPDDITEDSSNTGSAASSDVKASQEPAPQPEETKPPADGATKTDGPAPAVDCMPLDTTIETNIEVNTVDSIVEAYTESLVAAVTESKQTIDCPVHLELDHSLTKPQDIPFNEVIVALFNEKSAANPLPVHLCSGTSDSKNQESSQLDVDSLPALTTQQAITLSVGFKPFDTFVSECVNSSASDRLSTMGDKLTQEAYMAQAMNNAQKAPTFNATTAYGPRYTQEVPKITFRSSGDDIQSYIQSVEGRQVIQQAKAALSNNLQSMQRLENKAFLQTEQAQLLTAYSKEVENKTVGYFVVSNNNIQHTLKQLAGEKTVIQERVLSKQNDLQKLLSKKALSENQFESLKSQLIQTPNQMSIRSYDNLALAIRIIPLQNEVIQARTELCINDANTHLAHRCQEINNQQLEQLAQKISDKALSEIKALGYDKAKLAIIHLETNKAQFEREVAESLVLRDIHIKKVDELNTVLKSAWWFHKDQINADISKEIKVIDEAEIAYQTASQFAEIVSKIIVAGQQIIDKKALELTPAQALQKYEPLLHKQGYDSSTIQHHENDLAALYQYTEHSDLITALSVTFQDQGAVFAVVYNVDPAARTSLERLGVEMSTINAPFTGNHVQHYVHKELIDSLCKIATIEHTSPQVDKLLKTAVAFNSTGHALNERHELVAALHAKAACDAFIDCAKIVADVCFAVAEGVVEGVAGTVDALGAASKAAVDAATFPEETIKLVHNKFNDATLAVGRFFTEMRKDFELAYKGDEKSMHEWDARRTARSEKVDAFFEALEKKYYETPLRDKVKLVSRFFTECELLGALGGALFQEAAAVVDMVKFESEVAARSVADIFSNPHKVLAQEVVDLAVQTVDKDAKLVESSLEFMQQDAEFLAAAKGNIVQASSQFIERLEIKGARYTTLNTGERCRLVYPKDIVEAELVWAPQKYEEIRALTDDVRIIAQNVNIPEAKIKCIKDHLFYNEHILDRGIAKFDPNSQIASAWDRLYKGDFIQNDLKLLEHEYYEAKFEKVLNLNYRDAHEKALDAGKLWDYPE